MENKNITLTAEQAERLEMFVFYYNYHGVKNMTEKRPEFVIDDFEEVLTILTHALDLDYILEE